MLNLHAATPYEAHPLTAKPASGKVRYRGHHVMCVLALAKQELSTLPPTRPTTSGNANERHCAKAVKLMMQWLLPSFELISPLPPYSSAWEQLTDAWDRPVWAAAKASAARYVVSENTHDYAMPHPDGHHLYEGIGYLSGDAFLQLLAGTDLE